VYSIITKQNEDQRWDRDNEAWELLRTVSAIIWKHYEKRDKWGPDPGVGQF
jgi:beta-lactamase class A